MSAPEAVDIFAQIVGSVLPRGGYIMILAECYFDESMGTATVTRADGTTRQLDILCVAGYLIEAEAAKRLSVDWQTVLDWKGLPYFHMVDCAHGNGPFRNLSKTDRIQIVARMIGLIKRHTIQGFAVTVNLNHYDIFMPKQYDLAGAPYTFCVNGIIGQVAHWTELVRFKGKIAYFFEAGHASRTEAGRLMEKIFDIAELRETTKYAAHAFVEKTAALPLQAADLLAWQFYTDVRRQAEGKTVHRKDFDSLFQHPHYALYVTPQLMTDLARGWGFNTAKAEQVLRANFGEDYLETGVVSEKTRAFWRPQS